MRACKDGDKYDLLCYRNNLAKTGAIRDKSPGFYDVKIFNDSKVRTFVSFTKLPDAPNVAVIAGITKDGQSIFKDGLPKTVALEAGQVLCIYIQKPIQWNTIIWMTTDGGTLSEPKELSIIHLSYQNGQIAFSIDNSNGYNANLILDFVKDNTYNYVSTCLANFNPCPFPLQGKAGDIHCPAPYAIKYKQSDPNNVFALKCDTQNIQNIGICDRRWNYSRKSPDKSHFPQDDALFNMDRWITYFGRNDTLNKNDIQQGRIYRPPRVPSQYLYKGDCGSDIRNHDDNRIIDKVGSLVTVKNEFLDKKSTTIGPGNILNIIITNMLKA